MSPGLASEQYDVSAHGKRFLVITAGDTDTLPLTLVQNWTAELKRFILPATALQNPVPAKTQSESCQLPSHGYSEVEQRTIRGP